MKIKKYTVSDNLISALLGVVIAIPLCVSVSRNQSITEPIPPVFETTDTVVYETPTVEQKPVEVVRDTLETVEDPEISKIDLGEFTITAYCPCSKCCGKWADGYTATMTIATEGRTIAVDPDVIPLGSVVEFNGKEYIAEDTGSSIKGNKIDLFFESHDDALEWGVQYHDIFLH